MEAHPCYRNLAACHKQMHLCTLCRQLENKQTKKSHKPFPVSRGQGNWAKFSATLVLKEIYQRSKQLPCYPMLLPAIPQHNLPGTAESQSPSSKKEIYFLKYSFIKFPVREQEPHECIGKSTTFLQCAPRAGLVMYSSHGHQISRAVLAKSNCSWEWELLVCAQLHWKSSLSQSTVLMYQLITSGSLFRRCIGLESSTTCIITH